MGLRSKVKQAIVEQLKGKGLYKFAHYKDLCNDYMKMWDIKNMLHEDIEERGVSVEYNHGGGQKGRRKNDSVSELIKINTQMLKILYDLGIRAMDLEVVDENEGNL